MDRITLEVIGAALLSAAEEMGQVLIRSSYSTNVKERQDCSTAVFDPRGNVIAQAEHIPMHLGSLIMIVQEVLRRYPPAGMRAGDLFVGNDPYTGGSTHLPDITVASPVFVDDELVAFVANIAHHADGSGRETRSIWDEGLRIPPLKLVEGGVLREDVMELLLLNFRLPRERRGDFRAQFAANRIGCERVAELFARHGRATCEAAMAELLAYGERKIRAALRTIPDGVYAFEDWMDDDGADGPPVPIRVTITVSGDEIALDWTGTGPQVPGDINVVYLALVATVYYALKTLLDPTIPANGGFYRAIRVTAPEGSIINARPPAAVAWRTQTCQRIADVVFGALAPALPERVIAATNGANSAWVFSGMDARTGQYYVYLETLAGGSGARATKDGLDAVQVHVTNTSNLPIEALEMEYPLLVEEYGLVPESAGAGRHRGGMGLRRTIPRAPRGDDVPRHARSRADRALGPGRRRPRRQERAGAQRGHAGRAALTAQARRDAPRAGRHGDHRDAGRRRVRHTRWSLAPGSRSAVSLPGSRSRCSWSVQPTIPPVTRTTRG
jgi:N-methylhydantoinase B